MWNKTHIPFRLARVAAGLVSFILVFGQPGFVAAGTGAPRVLNYQGRLMDSSGTLLGGTGTEYCFKFSLYDNQTVGSGSKVWPSGSPSPMTAIVKNGVFSVGVGDTNAGGDVLDFDFQSNDTVFLNVEVATRVGATCAPGDGAETFENLEPRNRIDASGYAINANTLGGFAPSQEATGSQVPVLSSGRVVLGSSSAGITATSSNVLTLQGASTGDIRFFNANNRLTSSGDLTLAGLLTTDRLVFVNATSTNFFSAYIAASAAAFGATATSSFNAAGQLILAGTPDGPLQANAGVVSATTTIGVVYGGTGVSAVPTFGQLLLGNGSGNYALSATSTLGLPTFASLASYLSLSAWYATTTDALAEGLTNKYFTVDRVSAVLAATTTDALAEGATNLYYTDVRATQNFVSNLAATSSVSSITTLPNLVLPAGQLAGFGVPFYTFFSATTTDALSEGSTNLYFTTARANANFVANLAATTSIASITNLPNLAITAGQVSDFAASVNSYVGASSTIAKTYQDTTFSAGLTAAGGFTIGSLTGPLQAQNGLVSATNTIAIAYGGTGTSTAPSYGKLLLGNSAGTYDLVSTSSLGINSAVWGSITGTLSNQTDLQNALNAKLDASAWYSTTTTALAEGSNLYFTTARATTSFIGNLAATTSVASITTLPNLSLAATQLSGFGIPFYQYFSATTTDALAQGSTNKYYSSALFTQDLAATTSVNSIIALNNLVITASQVSDFNSATNSYINASTTIPKTYTNNTFAGTQTFQNASTTNISASYASSTNLVAGAATTTALAISGLSSSLLKVNALGQVAGAIAGTDYLAPAALNSYLQLTDWYSTTTDQLQEGTNNLYFTTARATNNFVSNLAATTSVASITTLNNLSITASQVSNFASAATSNFVSNLAGTTSISSIISLPNLSLPSSQVTGLFGYLFPSNATNTEIAFNGGLTAARSTTTEATSTKAFAGNISANTASFGASATSSFASNGALTLAQQLTVGNGGTGATSFTYGLLGSNGGNSALVNFATSSLGLLSTNVAEGSNLYYTDARAQAFVHGSTTIAKTYTANTFSNTNTFNGQTNLGYASSTGISSSYASSTQGFFGSLSVGSLTGLLRASAGAIVTGAVNLASEVSGILNVANGGTGWAAIQAGSIPYGNGSGALATTSAGTAGQVLALLNGVPTWTATTSFAYPLSYSAGIVNLAFGTTTANNWSALQQFTTGASSTAASALDYVAVGRNATTTIRGETNATSTFAGGVEATALNVTSSTATSTFANGVALNGGCFSVNGQCIGSGTNVVLTAVRTYTTSQQWAVPTNLVYAVVEIWGGGGGGGDGDGAGDGTGGGGGGGYTLKVFTASSLVGTTSVRATIGAGGATTTSLSGSAGGTSNFGNFATSTGGNGGNRANGAEGAGGSGGVGSGGDINLVGEPGGLGETTSTSQQGDGGSSPRGGSGGQAGNQTTGNGAVGGMCGGGGGGAGGAAGGGGSGCIVIHEFTASNVSLGNGTVNTGSTGQLAYYTSSGNIVAGASALTFDSVGNRLGIASSTPSKTLSVGGDGYIDGELRSTNLVATGTLTVAGQSTLVNASTTNVSATYASSTQAYFGNASSTLFSSSYASSTQGFFGSLSIGSLSGILKATAGAVSTALVNLTTDVTGVLSVANGGTGWANIQANTLVTGNGAGAVATTSVGSSLLLSGGSLGINLGNANTWTALQTFNYSSSTAYSSFLTASSTSFFAGSATTSNLSITGIASGNLLKTTTGGYVVPAILGTDYQNFAYPFSGANNSTSTQTQFNGGLTATNATTTNATTTTMFSGTHLSNTIAVGASGTTTIDSAGNTAVAGTLNVTGKTTLGNASTTNVTATYASSTQANFGNASSTLLSASYASSTQGFFGSLSVGALTGVLRASAGAITTGAVNLASEVSGVLSVASGGTGWANIQAGTLVTGNGTGAVATTSIGSSLQISGSTLSLNLSNTNIWTGLQTFTNSSTTIISAYRAYFGGTATTTIDGAGNVVVGGSLTSTASDTILASTTATRFTVQNATSTNATSTTLYISGSLTGAGLTTCSNGTNDKLLWNSGTGQFSCGVDQGGAGGGISNLGAAGQLQNGASQTFATSTDANLGLTITSSANTHTFTTIWNGILSVARGGTGWGNIQAGTLLTGNGTGAVATTSVGSSLQISSNSLSLNLANNNIWTGLQQFQNASTTLLETISQFARTIQSTSTNALVLKTSLTATAGLTLGSTSTPQMFALDTQNNRATIGTGGATPTLFVVDSKNTTGDPAGVNGATYYNSNDGLWRCYASGWRTCGGQAASSTGAIQFTGTDGGFAGTSNFLWNIGANNLTIQAASSSQTTDLFTIASSTGTAMFGVSSNGVLELATTTDPTSPPPEGQLDIYAKNVAGRLLPKWEGPSGLDTPFQPALFGNNIAMWFPNTGTTVSVAVGTSWTARNSGTGAAQSTPAITSTSLYTSMKRGLFSTGTTATGSSGTQSSQQLVWRGNGTGLGGFFFFARVGVDSTYRSDVQMMTGVSALNAALTGQPSAQNNSILLGKDSGDTTWQIITRDGATANKVDTGLTIASGQILDFYIFARPGNTKVTVRLVLQTAGSSQVIVDNLDISSNLPVNTTMMYAHHQIRSTTGTATAGYALNRIYVETDI